MLSPIHITAIKLLKHHQFIWLSIPKIWYNKEGRKLPAVPPLYFLDSGQNSRSQWISVNICSSIPGRIGEAIRLAVWLANLKDNIDWFEARQIIIILKSSAWPWNMWCYSIRNVCVYGSLRQWCKYFLIEFYMDLCSIVIKSFLIPRTWPKLGFHTGLCYETIIGVYRLLQCSIHSLIAWYYLCLQVNLILNAE